MEELFRPEEFPALGSAVERPPSSRAHSEVRSITPAQLSPVQVDVQSATNMNGGMPKTEYHARVMNPSTGMYENFGPYDTEELAHQAANGARVNNVHVQPVVSMTQLENPARGRYREAGGGEHRAAYQAGTQHLSHKQNLRGGFVFRKIPTGVDASIPGMPVQTFKYQVGIKDPANGKVTRVGQKIHYDTKEDALAAVSATAGAGWGPQDLQGI